MLTLAPELFFVLEMVLPVAEDVDFLHQRMDRLNMLGAADAAGQLALELRSLHLHFNAIRLAASRTIEHR